VSPNATGNTNRIDTGAAAPETALREEAALQRHRVVGLLLLLAAAVAGPAAARAGSRDDDLQKVTEAIARFKEKSPTAARAFEEAYGYAVFPSVGKGGLGIGGARGKGYVYQRGRAVGRSTLTQVTLGLQLGGQAYSEVVFFKDASALGDFESGRMKLGAQASAVALSARAAGDLPYRDGIMIVTMARGGLMYEASIGGQKFSFTPVGQGDGEEASHHEGRAEPARGERGSSSK
jgi:lipid-binding SYLF domain-containing protein